MSLRSYIERGAVAVSASMLLMSATFSAGAATLTIDALFQPNANKPNHNVFDNKTPPGNSYCGQHPTYCAPGTFSIGVPITFRAASAIQPEHDVRQGAMFQVPSNWKSVQVFHEITGEQETVQIRVTGIGGAYTNRVPLTPRTWVSNWVYAPAPCQYGGVGYGNQVVYAFFWRVPEGAGVCAKQAFQPIPYDLSFAYRDLAFSYQLVTPNPLAMRSGTYRGQLTYGVGPHKDFDMGDVMVANDDQIVLNFNLKVEHVLKVEIPPGGNRVELVPQGGWQAWLNQGRKPARLLRDQTFNIYASSRFKMKLECQYEDVANSTCRVVDSASGRSAPLSISVSLPFGLTDALGQPVNRLPLRLDGAGTEVFQPTQYLDRKPGTLHFAIERDAVNEMLQPNESGSYKGNVTVIWDSEF